MGEEQPLGWVPVEGRGSLPFALVHGESLVAAASWALGEAEVTLYDASVEFGRLRTAGLDLVLHDPLCPLTPVDFVRAAVARCAETGGVVVGYRPVTDTVKHRRGDALGDTVDRSGLRSVASPIVIPAAVLAGLDVVDSSDFPTLVATLATVAEIDWLEAPPLARRVRDASDLADLEALSRAQSREQSSSSGGG
jgi:2-C-methyl-D-erythritol 4-phosphate cytidylyltransferase